jgi:HlyD family secretion protein
MKRFLTASMRRTIRRAGVASLALCLAAGCERQRPNWTQGYVEGEFVYVASPLAGALESLKAQRGMNVHTGDLLFTLDSDSERDEQDLAAWQVRQAAANLDDANEGKRPSEIDSVAAQLKRAQAALKLSETELSRQEQLALVAGAAAKDDLDKARSQRDQDRNTAAQLEADLATARLGARTNQVLAAEASVGAMKAGLAKATWDLGQKSQSAPKSGLVFDTFYREGEWVAAGRPIVSLLPPENIKVRAFVPETLMGAIHPGGSARVHVDGITEPLDAKISFISPNAEYTPPVIYSRESRSKLMYLVEMVFDPGTAAKLHPGQPVDVEFSF